MQDGMHGQVVRSCHGLDRQQAIDQGFFNIKLLSATNNIGGVGFLFGIP